MFDHSIEKQENAAAEYWMEGRKEGQGYRPLFSQCSALNRAFHILLNVTKI